MSQVKGISTSWNKRLSQKRGGVISFNFADVHPHDAARIHGFDEGIAHALANDRAQVLMENLRLQQSEPKQLLCL